jgi:predicted enzyme related to lactoylglutathione lyase
MAVEREELRDRHRLFGLRPTDFFTNSRFALSRQPMNSIAYFEIQAANPEQAIAFYQALFGWRFTRDDQLPIPYWRIETGAIRGGLLQRPAATPPPQCGTNAYVCSIEVADFDAVANKILSLGGQVALPKFAVPGVCWQGYFIDPDGNTFGVFQADTAAR